MSGEKTGGKDSRLSGHQTLIDHAKDCFVGPNGPVGSGIRVSGKLLPPDADQNLMCAFDKISKAAKAGGYELSANELGQLASVAAGQFSTQKPGPRK